MPKKQIIGLLIIPVLFFLIYFQVFFANYVYTDEANQVWHNNDGLNYTMFTVQGRWLTGLLSNKLFAWVSTIANIKYVRIFSFAGWILVVILWQFIFSKWVNALHIDKRLALLMNFYIVCCIPVSISIGWASCMQLFPAVGAGLLSGHLLFKSLFKKEGDISIPFFTSICSLILGIISLFFYQSAFGVFLLPFFIYYLKKQPARPGKTIIVAVLFYLFVYVVYYFLFNYCLKLSGMQPVNRAGISTDVIGKLSFLFSDPLPSAFSANILYTARSIFSQILAPLMMAGWAISVFIRYKKTGIVNALLHIVIVLSFLVLIYLPSMVVLENFASYRTLFAFNLAVFYLVTDQVLFFLKKQAGRKIFIYTTCIFLLATGFYNFNYQFVNPAKAERKAFISFMNKNVKTDLETVYFIRSDKFLFNSFFYTLPYKDEFGLPSTNKDWVPESLVKQYIFESTGNRSIAEKIKVIQFADTSEYNNAKIQLSGNDLLIDMNKIFRDYMNEKKQHNTSGK